VLFENLHQEMARRHLSHADIAHRSGLSLSAVKEITSAVEIGQSVNLDKIDRIAGAFGMSAAQLLSTAEVQKKSEPMVQASVVGGRRTVDATPKQLSRLIEEFFALPEADRRELLDTASNMASKYRANITAR
jgi:transcriptional regulator with XRE-family HTH domain